MRLSTSVFRFIACAVTALLLSPVLAQTPPDADKEMRKFLYRWTDARAQVNYGDRPPPDAQNLLRIDLRQIGEQVQSVLPYQVRRAASMYPVCSSRRASARRATRHANSWPNVAYRLRSGPS